MYIVEIKVTKYLFNKTPESFNKLHKQKNWAINSDANLVVSRYEYLSLRGRRLDT